MRISATIIVYNEARHIAALCETLSWADEIIIVDSHSTDDTVAIASRYTAHIHQREFRGYRDKHEYADGLATGDWIFWIDADERVTDELRDAIQAVRQRDPATLPDGFQCARKTFYLGLFVRHGGWYPDHKMRLYRKAASYWDGIPPHETARVRGRVETLAGDLLHYTKDSISDQHLMLDSYSTLAADHHVTVGRRVGAVGLVARALAAFLRTLVLKQGFRDGTVGLIIAVQTAYGVFLKYAKVWERRSVAR